MTQTAGRNDQHPKSIELNSFAQLLHSTAPTVARLPVLYTLNSWKRTTKRISLSPTISGPTNLTTPHLVVYGWLAFYHPTKYPR
jgi:hypothetical protein